MTAMKLVVGFWILVLSLVLPGCTRDIVAQDEFSLPFSCHPNCLFYSNDTGCSIVITAPLHTNVILANVNFSVNVSLPLFFPPDNMLLPDTIYYTVWYKGMGINDTISGNYNREASGSTFSFIIKLLVKSLGQHDLYFNFYYKDTLNDGKLQPLCDTQIVNFLAIPGPLTLLPPIVTIVTALLFRQVLIALLLGIWTCALLAHRYNPLIATLRTIDTYFVKSVADTNHAAIALFTFFLGGLIGVVQRSGGNIGLASILKRVAGSKRRALMVCIILAMFVFFDGHSLVLICGISLRTIMYSASVSVEKFAFILRSLGPTIPNIIPISSWMGVQVESLYNSLQDPMCHKCPNLRDADAYILTVRTLPYRFFPLLLIFSVVFIAILNRDFGPLLWAEQKMFSSKQPLHPAITKGEQSDSEVATKEVSDHKEERDDDVELEESCCYESKTSKHGISDGPLMPKSGVKHRWINAVIPFLIITFCTLIAMVLDGWQTILDQSIDERVPMNIMNIFSYANSINALLWASALACAVAMVMLLIQRILSLSEYMESWIAGVNTMIKPFLVIWFAWALGSGIQDIQTNHFLAHSFSEGAISIKYIPAIITIIGFFMSFATGSSFGAMGIIFPLIIPTMCEISNCNEDAVLHTSAAILASSSFGNVISPVAGLGVLTLISTQCSFSAHMKTATLYVIIIAVVSVLFGALPVGAGWYPWYAGWIIQAAIIVIIFILFSSSADSLTSRPLLKRLCPCLYSAPARLVNLIKKKLVTSGCYNKLQHLNCKCKCCRKKNNQLSTDDSEQSPIIT